ncbi:sigma 54-interacting transcriptional regulator [Desulfosarcina cetonica]|uniref:sigma 54-interacting transcriptional regulator n=1 Tax=Desulfosarcina cetonica TaxID=90730 RepID=UPI0006D05C71|nr:sigma 54-interacting transcriptional regulator [Desulfosarcina cetonica]
MMPVDLTAYTQNDFIDAAIGICTCRNNALSPTIQIGYLERAAALEAVSADPIREVRLVVLMARALMKIGKYDDAARRFDQAWQMVVRHDFPVGIQLQVALANSEFLFWQGLIDKAIERYESVISNHEELPTDVETLKPCAVQGWIYGIAGETARGLGLIEQVRSKALEIKDDDLVRYATLMMAIVLCDARRIDEMEACINEIFKTPEIFLDHFILWPGNGKRAFLAYCRGDDEAAFHYQHQAYENSLALQFPHHRGPDNFEFMLGLEKRGFVHPHWNFDSEIKRLLDWPDIYMRGVALRYRALRAFERGDAVSTVKGDLKASIDLLTRSGARIELSHARVLLARVLIQENDLPQAQKLLKPAWDIFSRINPDLFPKDLESYLDASTKNALWVDSLVQVGDALGTLRERKQLLGQIIRQAMRIAGAERGAVFLKGEHGLEMAANRNIESAQIATPAFHDPMALIEKVFDEGRECIRKASLCRPEPGGVNCSMGWMSGFPIRLKARVLGVIFMDCRLTPPHLSESEISLLRIISNQAAVALENLAAYEEITDLKKNLEAEAHFYRKSLNCQPLMGNMIGRSAPYKEVLRMVQQVAHSDATVMITGETGVGKDLVAQAIHQNSARRTGPFIAVNVVSLSPELIASELFGHEKGAFTGASQARIGRFELASQGTLFLDDIDAFSLDIQAKLLRVLETKEFERVGGSRTLKTRFRLVAASNRQIETLVEKGLFRSDFYFRLNVFPIRIPPLRERQEDIPALTRHFMNLFGQKTGKTFDGIPPKDMQRLLDYSWPGNVRELRHIIERAVLLSSGRMLSIPPLDVAPTQTEGTDERFLSLREIEARHIIKALKRSRGRVSGTGGAASLLGLKPTTLYSMMKRLGVEKEGYRFRGNPS